MYKNAALKQQFLSRTGNYSTFSARDGRAIIENEAKENLNLQQQREAAQVALRAVQARIAEVKALMANRLSYKEARTLKLEKDELTERHQALCGDLSILNKSARQKQNVGAFIIDVMRERLTKPEWDLVVQEAHRRHDLQD